MTGPYDDDPFDYGSLPDQEQREFLYDQLGFAGLVRDVPAHDMFWDAMYNDELTVDQRWEIFNNLQSYIFDEYGIVLDDIWSWEDFREWYAGVTG